MSKFVFFTFAYNQIIDNPEGYFAIDPNTGAVTIARVIDYERPMESTTFVVTATDSGDPRLTSTATVSVTVININDNNPIFTRVSKLTLY